jgi:hypothetical protein
MIWHSTPKPPHSTADSLLVLHAAAAAASLYLVAQITGVAKTLCHFAKFRVVACSANQP